tara:strand:- start:739 stop:993 length:255 start_codon:yes stop_codon:yes gene_type:complete
MENNITGNEYDKFINKDVTFTLWNGEKQYVKIIKNDKKNKELHVVGDNLEDVHYLIYKNIGEGNAVVKMEIDSFAPTFDTTDKK